MTRPRVYCVVYGCLNTSTEKPELSFFKLPANAERRSNWLSLIGREDLKNKIAKNYTVCEDHFYTQDVLPGKVRKTLKSNSLPALCLPELHNSDEDIFGNTIKHEVIDIPMDICPENYSQPLFKEQETASTSTLLKSIKQEKVYEEETEYKVEHLHKLCDKFLTKEMAELVKTQTNLTNNSTGQACHDYKQFCLILYLINPQAYRLLKNALCLPSPNINVIPMTTDINGRYMLLLKSKVMRMTEMEKNCSVMIDTMSLNSSIFYNTKDENIIGFQDINGVRTEERAKVAFVMMVRGIYDTWKQPVGYALLSDCNIFTEIYKWIDDLLEKLFAIGLNVRTFVSITWSCLFNPAKNKSISIEKPYFFVGDRKIYYIFDVPHLFKLLRNQFMENDFHFQECVAKFQHIILTYSKDKTKAFRIAEKLTNSHIHPNNFEKTKMIYAVQLFSNSVATALSTYLDFNTVELSAKYTVEFIKLMNDLFDILNSSDLKDKGRKSAFRGEESQIVFFKEMLVFFKNLKLINSKTGLNVASNSNIIEGFQITLTSILQLFSDLNSEGCTYLLTRRLNMDVLEILHYQVRKRSGITSEPSSHQFLLAYRKWFFSNVINLSNRRNRIDDIGEILNELQLVFGDQVCENEPGKIPGIIQKHDEHYINIASSDYDKFGLFDKPCIMDISAYLVKKCFEYHSNCDNFKSHVKPNQRLVESFNKDERYQRYRIYRKLYSKSLLVVPYDIFTQFVEKMERKFVPLMQSQHMNYGITSLIFKELDKISFFSPPCSCFPKDYIVKLFIRMRIYMTIKLNNKVYTKIHKHFTVSLINN